MLPNEVFFNANSVLLIHTLFEKCFESGILPDTWSESVIKPIPKNKTNDPRIPLNYRGISLIPTMCKLFSMVLNNRLTKVIESLDMVRDEQNGFRKTRACIDHLYVLTTIIKNRKVRNLPTFACMVDFAKAFDKTDREMLLFKLLINGLRGKIYQYIKAMYLSTKCCLNINTVLTDWFSTESGLKQGDNLSSTLWNIFLNDLVDEINNLNVGIPIDDHMLSILLYADDMVLLAENEQNLQLMIQKLDEFCSKWRLTINVDKTNIIHFRQITTPRSNYEFKCGNKILSYASKYKYLECILSETMDFTVTVECLAESAERALGMLINRFFANKHMSFQTYTKLYHSCICPIMDYASDVWGHKYYSKCDTVQNKAIRIFLGVHKYASNVAIQGDVAWIPPHIRRKLNMIRLWHRLVSMDVERLTHKVFLWDTNSCKRGAWSYDIKQVFADINRLQLYSNRQSFDLHAILRHAETVLMEAEKHKWNVDLDKQSKLRTYKLFKSDFKLEDYVHMDLSLSQRSILAQIRCGILPLHIETGRFEGKAEAERLCKFCDTNSVESDTHFLFQCPLYIDHRNTLYDDIGSIYPDFKDMDSNRQLSILMNDKHCIRKTIRYLQNSYSLRNWILYS